MQLSVVKGSLVPDPIYNSPVTQTKDKKGQRRIYSTPLTLWMSSFPLADQALFCFCWWLSAAASFQRRDVAPGHPNMLRISSRASSRVRRN
ncbi:hypothetical protein LSAT2_024902 [Lamellibrachia satsuma]|nr:hypothetical protein LSAT2_024902 [Lamellibrachia satsuma]